MHLALELKEYYNSAVSQGSEVFRIYLFVMNSFAAPRVLVMSSASL